MVIIAKYGMMNCNIWNTGCLWSNLQNAGKHKFLCILHRCVSLKCNEHWNYYQSKKLWWNITYSLSTVFTDCLELSFTRASAGRTKIEYKCNMYKRLDIDVPRGNSRKIEGNTGVTKSITIKAKVTCVNFLAIHIGPYEWASSCHRKVLITNTSVTTWYIIKYFVSWNIFAVYKQYWYL